MTASLAERVAAIPWEDRCPTRFERRTPGKRYVNARWQCPRRKLKGLPYCGYCEPSDKKRERLATLQRLAGGVASEGDR